MPTRPSSLPVAGSLTAAAPPAAAVQPPLYTWPRHVASSRKATGMLLDRRTRGQRKLCSLNEHRF
jgi:hypothetical protein